MTNVRRSLYQQCAERLECCRRECAAMYRKNALLERELAVVRMQNAQLMGMREVGAYRNGDAS